MPVFETWRHGVDAALEERGESRSDLARAMGVSTGAISAILTGRYKASTLVRPISDYVKIAVPMPVVEDDEMAEWFSAGEKLRTSNREAFRGMLRTVKAMTGPPEKPARRDPKGGSNGK